MSLYPPPQVREMTIWTSMPDRFRHTGQIPDWARANKPGHSADCFLEGPSFDRDGRLWVTDIPYGRIFTIDQGGDWSEVIQYDGWPNGLKFHRDGRIFIADYQHGILQLDPERGQIEKILTHRRSESFRGVNDLFFANDGRLYFTDQGQTGMHDATGRVYRYDLDTEQLDCLVDTCPSPNGLVMNHDESVLLVAMTRGNAVWRIPVLADGGTTKVSIFTALAGGISGADGMALDDDDNLYVCDAGNGCVWTFNRWAEPVYRLRTPSGGRSTTNLAFGGEDARRLFVTESDTGNILTIDLETAGKPMFG